QRGRMTRRVTWMVMLLALAGGCSKPAPQASQGGQPPPAAAAPAQPDAKTAPAADAAPEYEAILPDALRQIVSKPFTGDFDDMGAQRGLAYEYMNLFEDQLNKQLNTGNLKIHAVMMPMPRDALLPALRAGRVDIVVAQLTVTPARQQLVDFTEPTRRNVDEV